MALRFFLDLADSQGWSYTLYQVSCQGILYFLFFIFSFLKKKEEKKSLSVISICTVDREQNS